MIIKSPSSSWHLHDQHEDNQHLVAKHVIMHQLSGIGMMQYITKMMKTKYLQIRMSVMIT